MRSAREKPKKPTNPTNQPFSLGIKKKKLINCEYKGIKCKVYAIRQPNVLKAQ